MSKKDDLKEAVEKYNKSNKEPEDLFDFLTEFAPVIRQGSGLIWSEVKEIVCYKREPVRREDGSLHTFMLTFDNKPFRCDCGCNVFHKPDDQDLNRYKCNSCPVELETE